MISASLINNVIHVHVINNGNSMFFYSKLTSYGQVEIQISHGDMEPEVSLIPLLCSMLSISSLNLEIR